MASPNDDDSSSGDSDKEPRRGITVLKKIRKSRKRGIRLSVISFSNTLIIFFLFQCMLILSLCLGWVER